MLDEHTQVESPCQATKQTMTERSSIPQRDEDKEVDQLYKVFKDLLKHADKKVLLQELSMMSESIPQCRGNLPPITDRRHQRRCLIKKPFSKVN